MKRWLLAAACGVVALGLLLYPLVGELLSEKYHSDVETSYTAAIEDTDDAELTAQREAAEQYNAMLANATISEGGASAPPLAYADQLTVGGVMAYVDIPQIGVYLPVQHGTEADTLEKSVGHVVGTSLPVGGENTHAVLSAHSGMASSKLFSDIDQLEKGDVFYIRVLGEVLAYEVDAINTVLPTDTSLLQIEAGKDLVTLVTCTPFGINTHRLFVHGKRIPFSEPQYQKELSKTPVTLNSRWRSAYGRALLAGGMFAVCLIVLLVLDIRKIIGVTLVIIGCITFISPEIVQEYYQIRTKATLKMYDEQQNVYEDKTEDMLYQRMLAYNQFIFEDKQTVMNDPWDDIDGSFGMEDLSEKVIGYVDVPALNQVFPIYFGATTEHMSEGVAVMSGSSMPIGGDNTNCVLAGHRGYNQSKTFFKEIENLVEGDVIYVTNQWEKLQYRVTKIDIVDPDDFEAVRIQSGKDMLTLLTCHPYGSHGRYRYLVYCIRTEDGQCREENKSREEKQIDYIAASDGRIYPSSKQDIQREKAFRLWCAAVILLVIIVPGFKSRRRRYKAEGDEN